MADACGFRRSGGPRPFDARQFQRIFASLLMVAAPMLHGLFHGHLGWPADSTRSQTVTIHDSSSGTLDDHPHCPICALRVYGTLSLPTPLRLPDAGICARFVSSHQTAVIMLAWSHSAILRAPPA